MPRRKTAARAAGGTRAIPTILADQADFDAAIDALAVIDPSFVARTVGDRPAPALRRREPGLEGLAGIVVAQQVSTASAAAIFGRLKARLGAFAADDVHAASDDDLKRCGLSAAKLRTIRALAEALTSGALDVAALARADAEAAHASLCALRGIGPWTADVFLLFCLGHADAWPAGDLALQEGARLALDLQARPDTKALIAIGERWRPLRGVAAHCLWAYYSFRRQAPSTLDAAGNGRMMAELDGPRLGAKNAKAGSKPKQLVVLLHGYGADGKDLIEIGKQWQPMLPDAVFVAPHAPEPCGQAPMGKQWFALTMRDPNERWVGVNKAAPVLDAFLDAELASHGLADDKLALVGFSQGTMMALHVGLRRRRPPAGIVGFSGTLVGPEHIPPYAASGAAPILLTHGSNDEVIPADAMFIAAEDLAAVGIPAQWHLSAGVGHGIDGGALTHAGLFLAKAFGVRVALPPAAR